MKTKTSKTSRKITRQIISTVLALVMLLSFTGVTAFATETTDENAMQVEAGDGAGQSGELKEGENEGENTKATESYEVVFRYLANKLFRYDNYNSSISGIQGIDTKYATITPTVITDDTGAVTSVSITAEQIAEIVSPSTAMGFSGFIGWGTTENANDGQILDLSAGYTFDISAAVKTGNINTFNLYAKYSSIVNNIEGIQLYAAGNFYKQLAYTADYISTMGMLPAAVMAQEGSESSENASYGDSAGLTGNKTAQWEDYAQRIGSIQFELAVTDVKAQSDTDIIILLDKSTSMNNTYLGNNVLAWPSAVNAVEDLASLLLGNGNSQNNRVALVQFAGNTINSFNFQNNYESFINNFVTTSPGASNVFRDANGNVIYDHHTGRDETDPVKNPSGDGTNFTIGLEQAQIFAESRGESDRELVILMVSDGKPEALVDFDLPYNSQMRHWERTYNGVSHHAVVQLSSDDQSHPAVIANDGMSVINSGFTPVINTFGIFRDTDQLEAISTATGGSHAVIGWDNTNDIETMSTMLADIFDGEIALVEEVTDTVLSDIITADFEILIDGTHPITLNDNGVDIPLTENNDATLDLHEYEIETISYNGEDRQQIKVNIGNVDKNKTTLKFFIVATDLGMPAAFYPTNEEHLVEYKEGEEEKSRNDLGEPELQVLDEIEQPPIIVTPPINETPDPIVVPVPPVVVPPVDEDPDDEDPIVIPDPQPPLDDGPDDEVIIDDPVAPLSSGAAWALLNLILTVLTAFTSIYLLINYFKERKDENGEKDENYKRRGFFRGFSVVVALCAIIAFILTEDMTLPMIWTDKWTILMVAIAFVQAVVVAIVKKQSKEEKEVYEN